MKHARQYRNIALIGFMGTGKSTIGRLLADQLRFAFLDTDELIESRAGKSISKIFEEEGEPAFRALEQSIVRELSSREGLVIATGGGLGANESHLAGLKQHSLVVCLWAPPESIWERVRHQPHRPLLKTADPRQKIRELLAAREPAYKQADIMINTDVRSPREVAQRILKQFQAVRPENR